MLPGLEWEDALKGYEAAGAYLKQEQEETRDILLDVLQAHRLSAASMALKRGQLMALSSLLRDAGAVINEAGQEQQSQAIELKLNVAPPPKLTGTSEEPIDVEEVKQQELLPEGEG